MKKMPVFDYSGALDFITEDEILKTEPEVSAAFDLLEKGKGKGVEYTGWLELPFKDNSEEIRRIKNAAAKIRQDSDILIVIGIGGSYLGASAALGMLSGNLLGADTGDLRIIFAGNSLSPSYLSEIVRLSEDKDISLNVISKSGTTLEPAAAFRVLRDLLEKKYGKEKAASRIYVTTDRKKGVLHDIAVSSGYESFTVPEDVGGRYSVLTAVGLLPICAAGLDIDLMLKGASDCALELKNPSFSDNMCCQYAAVRNLLYRKGKKIELMCNFEPGFHNFTEWWKQLFCESEGKNGLGIFPAGADLTTDLHSMGQYIQDGERIIFETFVSADVPYRDLVLPELKCDDDGLNYIAGKSFDFINKTAARGTKKAHISGGVPVLEFKMADVSEYSFGASVFFFEKACGISGYMLGVNPFDQPGVEVYKKNMFSLLGRK